MVIALVLLFVTCLSLSFFEEKFKERDKKIIYIFLGVLMILIAGLREVGSTPDTEAYEDMYYGKYFITEILTEPTFLWISALLKSLSLSVGALFMTYAIISIPLHLSVLWRMSSIPLLTLTIYISYYYMMHDMVQIRAAIASGLFLWAIYFYVEKHKMYALGCILVGILFHYSAATGLILFLLREEIPHWQKHVLYAIVPIGFVAYFTDLDISYLVPEELGGAKLMAYRELKEKGLENDQAGWALEVNILIWMNIVLYYASIYYQDFLTKHCKYVPIAIKVQAVGFCCLFFLKGVSKILGNRLNDYFSVASIILWTASVFAFYPTLLGKVINNVISSIRFVTSMLAYALSLLFL